MKTADLYEVYVDMWYSYLPRDLTTEERSRFRGVPYSRHARRKHWLKVRAAQQRRPDEAYRRANKRLRVGGDRFLGPKYKMHTVNPINGNRYCYWYDLYVGRDGAFCRDAYAKHREKFGKQWFVTRWHK